MLSMILLSWFKICMVEVRFNDSSPGKVESVEENSPWRRTHAMVTWYCIPLAWIGKELMR
jgi:hypothetical protein